MTMLECEWEVLLEWLKMATGHDTASLRKHLRRVRDEHEEEEALAEQTAYNEAFDPY